MSKTTILTWIDLETTGLGEDHGRILEYAIVLTDLELNELASLTAVIPQNVSVVKTLMDSYVTGMHTDNGLLDELDTYAWQDKTILYEDSIEEAQANILELIRPFKRYETIFVIAGSTVGFDKKWIKKEMSTLFEELHYRQLDVSGHKIGFPELFDSATSPAHRAMADIRASIAVQAKMRELLGYTALSHGE